MDFDPGVTNDFTKTILDRVAEKAEAMHTAMFATVTGSPVSVEDVDPQV